MLTYPQTTFEQYGYNIWVPSIPNGTNAYDLPINLPAGLQFVVTVWGKSGVEYAGTTDVLSKQRVWGSSADLSLSRVPIT